MILTLGSQLEDQPDDQSPSNPWAAILVDLQNRFGNTEAMQLLKQLFNANVNAYANGSKRF